MMFTAKLATLVAALVGLVPLISAAPTAAHVSSTFSFVAWVDSIIANPGNHLSPEEALAAWQAGINTTQTVERRGSLEKRYLCNTIPNTEASVPDAVWCINYLAGLGNTPCRANAVATMCTHGNGQITGVAGGGVSDTTSSCNDVARGAGFVMDHCTRADNTVQGTEMAYGNGNLAVWIRRPA